MPLAEVVLPAAAHRIYLEFIDAGEYGLAIEVAVEALPSPPTAPTDELRSGLAAAAAIIDSAQSGAE